jgi:hypothetical protein
MPHGGVAARAHHRPMADSSLSVLLSIGGTRYESTRATLSQSAFFAALLGEDGAGRFAAPADGVYRVDRDGAAFGGVLEYLRHGLGDMALPDALLDSPEAVAALGREAGFYALDELRAFAMKVMLIRGHDCDLPPGLLLEGRGPPAELYRLYGSDDKIVGEDLLSACFPAFYSTLNEKRTPGKTTTYFNNIGPHFYALLRYAALTGSSDESWALPRPARALVGVNFTFVSNGRMKLQREFDAAEQTRVIARGGP